MRIRSENQEADGEESEDEAQDKTLPPIIVGNEDFMPRYVNCVNCEAEFDVTSNMKGDCVWHPRLCKLLRSSASSDIV
jgi:hypothetical protein